MIVVLNEVSEQPHISAETLREYKANGLLEDTACHEGLSDKSDQFIRRICLINFLLKSGMSMDGLKSYLRLLDENPENHTEQLRILRKQRCSLLEKIHVKQQILDELDYMVRETKKDSKQ